jgi:hypothetical protein
MLQLLGIGTQRIRLHGYSKAACCLSSFNDKMTLIRYV